MPFTPQPVPTSLDRLKSTLLVSGLQKENNSLFQVIDGLITAVRNNEGIITNNVTTVTTSVSSILSSDLLTWSDEVAIFPNSRQLIAGNNISFDDSVPNQRSINVSPFTAGSIPFSNGTLLVQDNINLFFDNTNNRLGVGINTPARTLDVNGLARIGGAPSGAALLASFSIPPSNNITLTAGKDGTNLLQENETYGAIVASSIYTQNTSISNGLYSNIICDYTVNGTGDVLFVAGLSSLVTYAGSGTIGQMFGLFSGAQAVSGIIWDLIGWQSNNFITNATVTNVYGIQIVDTPIGGTGAITNQYGLWIGDITSASSLKYSIFTGLGSVHFGDHVDLSAGKNFKLSGATSGTITMQTAAIAGTWSLTLPTTDGNNNEYLRTDGNGVTNWSVPAGTGANTALSNLASVAINTTLVSDTNNTDDLGSTTIGWRTGYFATSIRTPSIISVGALTVTPAAGNSINFALSTTGDFIVNTNTFVVDTSAASIGINTTAPVSQLHITTDGNASSRGLTIDQHNTGAQAAIIQMRKSRGTLASPTIVADGDFGAAFSFQFYSGGSANGGYNRTAWIASKVNGSPSGSGTGSVPTDLLFSTGSIDDGSITNERMRIISGGNIGIRVTAPTAYLHLAAGTATAGTAPLKFNTGTSLTTAEAGAEEFTTDDRFFTITTGAARKRYLFADPVGGLTSGRIPFATTNGRLTDDADLTFVTDTLTATKIIGSTNITTPTVIMSNTINLIATGTAPTSGQVTLGVGGTATVNTTAATATCLIFFQRITNGGTIGFATTYTKVNNTSFTISSDNALDTSTYNWWIVETH